MKVRRSVCILSLIVFAFFVSPVYSAAPDTPPSHSSSESLARELKKFQLGPGLKIEPVASEPLLENPVAFSIDGAGRFFVVETHRYRDAIFDITANTPWLLDDLSFRDVADRAAFLARTFSTNSAFLTNSSERIRLVEDRDGDGMAETSSTFADDFRLSVSGTAAGVLAQGSNVWFTCIPDLWRLTSNERRGIVAETTLKAIARTNLASGLGVHISVSGHDVHGLIRGPDGRIYFSFGDRGIHTTNQKGEVLNVPDTGGVLRCEPDGRDLEVFCTGLRNPQELAFDDSGNLWTVDNDTAGADPCRVLHLVESADYGWRASYQHMKGFGPWVQEELWRGGLSGILPPAGTVSQGPAGLAFHPGPNGMPQLSGRFLHADFPGGIWAYNVTARGASYAVGQKDKVLWGCWPTDVDFGPDGALYVLDWVQGWTPPGKGRIYRITSTAIPDPVTQHLLRETKRLLKEGMGQRGERELLTLLGHQDRRVRLEAQWELAGRGSNSLAALAKQAQKAPGQLARIHALWAIRQILRPLPRSIGGEELASLLPLLQDKDPEIRGQAALALGEGCLFNAEKPMAALLKDPSPRVRLLTIQGYTAMKRSVTTGPAKAAHRIYFSKTQRTSGWLAGRAAEAVGADPHKAAMAVGAGISGHFPAMDLNQLLPQTQDEPFLAQAAVRFLTETRRNGAFESHHAISPSIESALALLWANQRAGRSGLGDFFTNSQPRILLETARSINDTPIPADYPALAAMLVDPRFRNTNWGSSILSNVGSSATYSSAVRPPRDQVLRRALNAHYRLGEMENASALARFAVARPEAVERMDSLRVEALFLLGAWEVLAAKQGDLPVKPAKDPNHGSVPTVNPENWPGWFDRVTGLWRPLKPRAANFGRVALEPHIDSLVADPTTEVSLAAIDAAVKLHITNATSVMLTHFQDTNTPSMVRQRIPAALAALDERGLRSAIPIALRDSDRELRAAILPFLNRLEGDAAIEFLRPIVRGVISVQTEKPDRRELRLAQAALSVLGRMQSSETDAFILELLTALKAGHCPADLELDLLEAVKERENSALRKLLAEMSPWPESEVAAWKPVLQGGDAERGRTVFFEKVEVQCSRCHQINRDGGTVGPALDGVGKRLNREELLVSILWPNKFIAPGFENVLLTLKNGQEHAGVVKKETEEQLVIASVEEGMLTLAKSSVTERRPSLSAMPENLSQQLSKRELRDLVEFLSGL